MRGRERVRERERERKEEEKEGFDVKERQHTYQPKSYGFISMANDSLDSKSEKFEAQNLCRLQRTVSPTNPIYHYIVHTYFALTHILE